jgi:hypothetical protein
VGAEARPGLDSRLELWESRGSLGEDGGRGRRGEQEETRTLASPQLGPQEFQSSFCAKGSGLLAPRPSEILWSIFLSPVSAPGSLSPYPVRKLFFPVMAVWPQLLLLVLLRTPNPSVSSKSHSAVGERADLGSLLPLEAGGGRGITWSPFFSVQL